MTHDDELGHGYQARYKTVIVQGSSWAVRETNQMMMIVPILTRSDRDAEFHQSHIH